MRLVIALLGSLIGALAVVAALDAGGALVQARMFNHAEQDAIAAALGALQAYGWHRFVRGASPPRAAFVGAIAAGLASFLLARSTLPWLDFGAIGAGPAGELPLLVLPIASLIAVLAVTKPRGAWQR